MADTIAAIATGNVRSAIGIIRLSGDGAIDAVNRVFRPKRGGSMSDAKSGRLIYGELFDENGDTIDLCLCTVSRAPHSYTGEDTAELQCHGSPVVLSEALTALFKAGARQAEAGEFTKRAFLNGKMDLTGAEAVIDLIDAPTAAAAKNASGQLGGAILSRAEKVYSLLADMSSHFQAVIDFPDDDIEEFQAESYSNMLKDAEAELTRLYNTYSRGRFMKEGVPCAIVGRPNVGKSSLLNAILGYDRAIVTATAGTTRDTIEETAIMGGIPLRISDTAGLRDTEDAIEREGVRRAESAAESAKLVIGVFDGSEPFTPEDGRTVKSINAAENAVVIINKSDLPQKIEIERITGDFKTISISAKNGTGLDALSDIVKDMFTPRDAAQGEILTNARQAEEVRRARNAIAEARAALKTGVTPDAVLTMTEDAMEAISSLTGSNVRDDIISRIFTRFCVGK